MSSFQDSQWTLYLGLDSQEVQPPTSQETQLTEIVSTKLTTTVSDPSAPTELQRALAFSLDAQAGDPQQSAAIVKQPWIDFNQRPLAGYSYPLL